MKAPFHFTKSIITTLAGASILFGLSACSPKRTTEAPSGLSVEKVVVALKPDKDPEKMRAERESLSEFLSAALNSEVEVIIPLSGTVIAQGLRNGTIDAAYTSGTDAARTKKESSADVLLANEIEGNPWYLSYWIALKDKPYTRIEDLKGKPIAFSSRTSTSGFIVPSWDLKQKGLIDAATGPEGFFGEGNVWYGTGYVTAAERVLSGEAEAAAVSYYVLDNDKHLSAEQRARLKMVASQGPVPTHTLIVRDSLPEADKAALKAAFLSLNENNPTLRDTVFGAPFVEVEPAAHLQPIEDALAFVEQMRK